LARYSSRILREIGTGDRKSAPNGVPGVKIAPGQKVQMSVVKNKRHIQQNF